ncbi:MAG TPA: universal stress protein [Pyrinomonadaceae bacterium]|jgi:nucleotide-binding universal stress UspA family protein|nr:universal stress protein [Pyrinomonadaceae bacterium]
MKILLAVDESPPSEEAVKEVGERSWPAGTVVRVLHVVEKFVPPAQELWYDAGGNLDRAREEIKHRAEEWMERMVETLRAHGLTLEVSMRDGDPKKAIVEEAKEWGADLIVVGSHGYTGVKRALLGSVSQAIVDHATCPVEVVHPRQTEQTE